MKHFKFLTMLLIGCAMLYARFLPIQSGVLLKKIEFYLFKFKGLVLIIEKPNSPNFINGITGNVLNVYTKPKYRKKGISTHIMNNLIDYAKEHHFDFIELKATKEGYPLYKKLGFIDYHSKYTDMKLSL